MVDFPSWETYGFEKAVFMLPTTVGNYFRMFTRRKSTGEFIEVRSYKTTNLPVYQVCEMMRDELIKLCHIEINIGEEQKQELYPANHIFAKLPDKFRIVGFDHEPIAILKYKHLEMQLDLTMIHEIWNSIHGDPNTTHPAALSQFVHRINQIEQEMWKDIHESEKNTRKQEDDSTS